MGSEAASRGTRACLEGECERCLPAKAEEASHRWRKRRGVNKAAPLELLPRGGAHLATGGRLVPESVLAHRN